MPTVNLKQVIDVVKTYLQECLPTKAKGIKIKKDEILSHGNVIQRAYFLLADCPEYKIQKYDKAKLVQFHGSCKATLHTSKGSQEIDMDPGVEILDEYNNPLLTLSISNMENLLSNLRAYIKFVPVAAASSPTTESVIVSMVQDLDARVEKISKELHK